MKLLQPSPGDNNAKIPLSCLALTVLLMVLSFELALVFCFFRHHQFLPAF